MRRHSAVSTLNISWVPFCLCLFSFYLSVHGPTDPTVGAALISSRLVLLSRDVMTTQMLSRLTSISNQSPLQNPGLTATAETVIEYFVNKFAKDFLNVSSAMWCPCPRVNLECPPLLCVSAFCWLIGVFAWSCAGLREGKGQKFRCTCSGCSRLKTMHWKCLGEANWSTNQWEVEQEESQE